MSRGLGDVYKRQALAQLHQLPVPDFVPKFHEYEISAFHALLDSDSTSHPFITWLEKTTEYLERNLDPTLPKCLIHGDIFNSNLVIKENNDVVILDFEEACENYRVFDIGMTIIGTCIQHGQLDWPLIQALLLGYQSVSPLEANEVKALKYFTMYAAAGTALWRYKQFNILFPDEQLKNHYAEMTSLADTVRASWPDNFDL